MLVDPDACAQVFSDEALLNRVLSYVQPASWLFIAAIDKAFRDSWIALHPAKLRSSLSADGQTAAAVHSHKTSYTAAFTSPARLKLAVDLGLALHDPAVQFAAGLHADAFTLLSAHELGLPFSTHLAEGCAQSGALNTLKWLLTECPLPPEIAGYAASSGNVDMLVWLQQQYSSAILTERTSLCAARSSLHAKAVLQYLHSAGCPFDTAIFQPVCQAGDLELATWLHQQVSAALACLVSKCKWIYAQLMKGSFCAINAISTTCAILST
jgi:hypothetical protein